MENVLKAIISNLVEDANAVEIKRIDRSEEHTSELQSPR